MSKNYTDLQGDEKTWIDQQYTRKEYDALRSTFLKSAQELRHNQTSPNPAIHSRLRQKLRESKGSQSAKVTSLYNYRIPAWQAVAAIAFILFFVPQLRQQQLPEQEKIFIYQTDTVFKEVPVESILNPIMDTLSDIPQVRKVFNRTNRSPVKTKTVVFSPDSALGADLSQNVTAYFASNYDTTSIEGVINQYLKDSVKSYRVAVDTGFQDLGRIY
jgi:hypothetical protein